MSEENNNPEVSETEPPEKKDERGAENTKKGLEQFEIDTDGKGGWTLKSGDKSKLSAKQLEWCEMMAKNAIGKEAGSVAYGAKNETDKKNLEGVFKESGADRINIDSKTGVVRAFDSDGKEIFLTEEQKESALKFSSERRQQEGELEMHSMSPQKLWSDMKRDFKQLGQGVVENVTDLVKTPFQMARDVYNFGKMIGQGRFKEATGKAAERINENLKTMIGMDTKDESKLYGISRYTKRNLTDPIRKTVQDVKQVGKGIKGLLDRLSGRRKMAPAKLHSSGKASPFRGRDDGRR